MNDATAASPLASVVSTPPEPEPLPLPELELPEDDPPEEEPPDEEPLDDEPEPDPLDPPLDDPPSAPVPFVPELELELEHAPSADAPDASARNQSDARKLFPRTAVDMARSSLSLQASERPSHARTRARTTEDLSLFP
jgi:hypothetical protein